MPIGARLSEARQRRLVGRQERFIVLRIASAIAFCFFPLLILSVQVRQNCHRHGFSRTLHAGRKTIRPLSPPSDYRRPPNPQVQCSEVLLRDSYQYGLPSPRPAPKPAGHFFLNVHPFFLVLVYREKYQTNRYMFCYKQTP